MMRRLAKKIFLNQEMCMTPTCNVVSVPACNGMHEPVVCLCACVCASVCVIGYASMCLPVELILGVHHDYFFDNPRRVPGSLQVITDIFNTKLRRIHIPVLGENRPCVAPKSLPVHFIVYSLSVCI